VDYGIFETIWYYLCRFQDAGTLSKTELSVVSILFEGTEKIRYDDRKISSVKRSFSTSFFFLELPKTSLFFVLLSCSHAVHQIGLRSPATFPVSKTNKYSYDKELQEKLLTVSEQLVKQ
jgi:hypothetical protein